MDKNYYTIMGVDPKASAQEIKTAYRRLARKYHPDISKEANAEERFKEMGEAYETLKDEKKRAEYDYQLQNRDRPNQHAHAPHESYQHYSNNPYSAHTEFDADLFESIFGHSRYQSAPQAGRDYQGKVHITLEEACTGTNKNIDLPSVDGEGAGTRSVKVKIPAGMKSGQQIRLAGQGALGTQGGARGDLYLTIEILKHPIFDVKDNDIYLTLPIAPWEAALGATITIPTVGGKIDLKIPAGSQGGQNYGLKIKDCLAKLLGFCMCY